MAEALIKKNSNKGLSFTNDNINSNSRILFLSPVTETKLIGHLIALKKEKSAGWDGITADDLINIRDFIIGPLLYICNLILETNIFPDVLKLAIVPIFETANISDINNY